MLNQNRPGGFQVLPYVTKNILVINVVLFLLTMFFQGKIDLVDLLGMHLPGADSFKPYQVISHIFMHGSIGHIFFNMLIFWIFGSVLENIWGAKRFLNFYLITGLGAAFLHYGVVYLQMKPDLDALQMFLDNPSIGNLDGFIGFMSENENFANYFAGMYNRYYPAFMIDPESPKAISDMRLLVMEVKAAYMDGPNIIGASGAVAGVMIAYAYLFPNTELYLYFIIPVKAKFLAIAYIAYELYQVYLNNPYDNIAHWAHLGGALFGFLIVRFWFNSDRKSFY